MNPYIVPSQAPTKRPAGPVMKMPSSGPRLDFGVKIMGPTKPATKLIPPRPKPPTNAHFIRARVTAMWPRNANHQHSVATVAGARIKMALNQSKMTQPFVRNTSSAKTAGTTATRPAAMRRAVQVPLSFAAFMNARKERVRFRVCKAFATGKSVFGLPQGPRIAGAHGYVAESWLSSDEPSCPVTRSRYVCHSPKLLCAASTEKNSPL